jgi:hypothetical protein
MFAFMKWHLLLVWLVAASFALSTDAKAQESPATIAAREELEANYKLVNSKVDRLEETVEAQQKAMGTVVAELHSLRQQVDGLKSRNESAATQESIKRLADKIEEVDRKRQADNELVLAQLKTLAKALSKPIKETTPPPVTRNEKPPGSQGEVAPENLLAYKIKDGDTLVRIVTDLRAQGFKITQKQVMDVNPSVNWGKLRIGQTVYIPKPTP